MKKYKKAITVFTLFILLIFSAVPVFAVDSSENADTTETTESTEAYKPLYTPRLTAPDLSNPYYYSNNNPFYASGYGMPNCTAYAWGRAYEILGSPPALPTSDARRWYERTTAYSKGQTPALGAIAVWWSDASGHVAVVEKIENGTVTFSNSAWGGTTFYLTTSPADGSDNYCGNRAGWTFLGFIYIADFGGITEGIMQDVSLNEKMDEQINAVINYVNDTWSNIGEEINKAVSAGDTFSLNENHKTIFMVIANLVIAIAFSMSVIEDFSMGIEINTNIAVNLIFPVIMAKVFVSLSYDITGGLINFFKQFIGNINVHFDALLTGYESDMISTVTSTNIFLAGLNAFPIFLTCMVAYIVALIILIKLYTKTIVFACLMMVSPAFFACIAGRPTKHIFEDYIRALLSNGFGIIYIFLVVILGAVWVNSISIVFGDSWFFTNLVKLIIIVAMGFMAVKTPRPIRNLI